MIQLVKWYILAKGTIIVAGVETTKTERATDRSDKPAIFKNYAPFTDCISKINNSQVDNPKDFDVVMPMYNLIKYSDNYSQNLEVYTKFAEMGQKIL